MAVGGHDPDAGAAVLVGHAGTAGAPRARRRTGLDVRLSDGGRRRDRRAGQELSRLQGAAEKAAALRRTARSQLPAAAALAVRLPVLTARGLVDQLKLSPQAALILLKQLVAAGVLHEATGRAAWRAFVVA